MSVIQTTAQGDPLKEARLMRIIRERRAAEAQNQKMQREEFLDNSKKQFRQGFDFKKLMDPTASKTESGGAIPAVADVPGQAVDNTVAVVLNFEGITIKGLAKMVASKMSAS